jgi:hypothetical protein
MGHPGESCAAADGPEGFGGGEEVGMFSHRDEAKGFEEGGGPEGFFGNEDASAVGPNGDAVVISGGAGEREEGDNGGEEDQEGEGEDLVKGEGPWTGEKGGERWGQIRCEEEGEEEEDPGPERMEREVSPEEKKGEEAEDHGSEDE